MVKKAKRKLEDVTFEEILDASPKLKNLKFPEVEDFRERVEQGDGLAVLQAIRWCCVRQIVIPKWLGKAYWDKGFGTPPHPKSAHVEARRKKKQESLNVTLAVYNALEENPDIKIDREFFETIGKPLALSASKAEKLYYDEVKEMGFNPLKLMGRE
ncbi:hypothetical protein N9H39_07100 [Gammaproteobacteria bacterium]|nr:hypothetical protein [Gammaproteobacteria bacterium]